MTTYNGKDYTAEQISAMRDWAKDCQWAEDQGTEFIDELTDLQVIAGVEKHYDGGLEQFVIDCVPMPITAKPVIKWNICLDIHNNSEQLFGKYKITDFDFIECSPCQFVNGDDAVERCNKGEEDFWSVYLHLKEGGCYCIADCATHQDAEQFCKLIEALTGFETVEIY